MARSSSDGAVGRMAASYLAAPSREGLLEELSATLREVVPFHAAAWFAADPLTGLPSSPAFAEGLGPESWECTWAKEYLEQDVLLFRDLARASLPAGSLHMATEAVPERSPRFRNHLRGLGVVDELRAVFRIGSTTWGQVTLLRCAPAKPFEPRECAIVAESGPAIAAALRARTARVQSLPHTPRPPSPGTVLYDADGGRVSMDAAAAAWFTEFAGPRWDAADRPPAMATVTAVVARANALWSHQDHGPSLARLRADNGRWLVLSASATQTDAGAHGLTVLTVDAARSAHIAAVLVEAFALTRRERDVTRALMLGLSNVEIGQQLQMSAHTVRDHLAAMFDKVRVGSRGELVARLLGEPGAEEHH